VAKAEGSEEKLTTARITRELQENLGLRAGDRIGVHSSLKSLGRVADGPTGLIDALVDAVGGPQRGTVLMPCFTQPLSECNVLNTPCRLGLVPETFRTYPGVKLSQNHTHRVAVCGKDAAAIAASHVGKSPLGAGSPFHELAKRGGWIVLIGCDFSSCSTIHVAEYIYPLPYNSAQFTCTGYDRTVTLVCEDGSRLVCPPIDNPGDSGGFLALQNEMEHYGLILHGRVGKAECMKVRGLDLLAMALEMLARDPVSLLCESPKCSVCSAKRKFMAEL